MKKAHLSALLVISLLSMAAAVGCTSQGGQADAPVITLTFRHSWTLGHDRHMEEVLRDAVERFERTHPDVRVLLEGIDPAVHRQQLRREMVAGNPPDIFSLYGGEELVPYAAAGRLLDLTALLESNSLTDKFYDLQAWQFEGSVYGLPLEGMAEPVFYNKRLFAQLGISIPENEAQLEKALRKMRAEGVIPFAIGNRERWPGAMYFQYFLQNYAGDRELNADWRQGRHCFDDFVQALRDFEHFLALQPFPAGAEEWTMDEAGALFAEGKAAMFMHGSWAISIFPESLQEQIGLFHFPYLWGMESQAIAAGYTSGIGISASVAGRGREAALALLKELYSTEVQQQIVYKALRLPSMRMNVDYSRMGPAYEGLADLLVARPTFIPYGNALPLPLYELLLDTTDRMIRGEFTAAEAAVQIERALVLEEMKTGGGTNESAISCDCSG